MNQQVVNQFPGRVVVQLESQRNFSIKKDSSLYARNDTKKIVIPNEVRDLGQTEPLPLGEDTDLITYISTAAPSLSADSIPRTKLPWTEIRS